MDTASRTNGTPDQATRRARAYPAFEHLTTLAYNLAGDPALTGLPRDQWPKSWKAIDAASDALYRAGQVILRERDRAAPPTSERRTP